MTDAEQHAAISEGRDAFQARHAAWLAAFIASGRDPRTLPQSEMLVSYPPPPEDLPTAVDEAALIVIGTSSAISFEPMAGATALDVERTLKGTAGEAVTIVQSGGPGPGPDWSFDTATLGYAPGDPLLLPGDRALLFLHAARDGKYYVQSFTGMYRLDAGVVAPLELNPFAGEVEGSTESALVGRILELVAEG